MSAVCFEGKWSLVKVKGQRPIGVGNREASELVRRPTEQDMGRRQQLGRVVERG